MTTNENGRAPTEVRATPDGLDAVQGIASTVPEYRHVLPMGATPWPTLTDEQQLAAIREAEGYVVVEVIGDVDGTPEVVA